MVTELLLLVWIFTILVPIHGLLYLGRVAERRKVQRIIRNHWLRGRR